MTDETNTPVIFVSHASDDNAVIENLADFLRSSLIIQANKIRITSAFGHKFRFGEPFSKLREEIKGCKAFVLFLTPQAKHSPSVMMEFGAAWMIDKQIFPLLTRGVSFSALGFESTRHSLSMDLPGFDEEIPGWLKGLAKAADVPIQDEGLRHKAATRFVHALQGMSPALAVEDSRSPRAMLRKKVLVWAGAMHESQQIKQAITQAKPDQVAAYNALLAQAREIDPSIRDEEFDTKLTSTPFRVHGLTDTMVSSLIAAARMLAVALE